MISYEYFLCVYPKRPTSEISILGVSTMLQRREGMKQENEGNEEKGMCRKSQQ